MIFSYYKKGICSKLMDVTLYMQFSFREGRGGEIKN